MTNLDALKSTAIGYPIDDNTFLRILLRRKLDPEGDLMENLKGADLAQADLYVTLLTAANVGEGGYAVSMTDKTNFANVASGIYERYGEPNPFKKIGTQNKVVRW